MSKMVTVECANCGKEFDINKIHFYDDAIYWCEYRCRKKLKYKQYHEAMKKPKDCICCGKYEMSVQYPACEGCLLTCKPGGFDKPEKLLDKIYNWFNHRLRVWRYED